jgi:glycolate oxidase iron-sulfur subunit
MSTSTVQLAFDTDHPPRADLLADCVHCGFCLPTCPTYVLWGQEMDSPRGRIYLMKQGVEGEPMSRAMVDHIDACLGCLACVTACPSGVRYDQLIQDTRAQVERRGAAHRSRATRRLRELVFGLFTHPERLAAIRPLLMAYQRLGLAKLARPILAQRPALAAMASIAPPLRRKEPIPARTPAQGPRRAVVGMLLGCVQREMFPSVNAATVRVLSAEGCDVIVPERQGCCGALSLHAGRRDEGLRYARALIDCFDQAGVDYVVVNSAGCGSSMKEYADLLADDPAYAQRAAGFAAQVRDVTEILDELGPVAPRHRLPVTVAYHDACHLSHGQGVRAQPRRLLSAIESLRLVEIADADLCCGSAGTYNVLHPEPARQLGDRKAAQVAASGAELLVTANPGCLMQISAALARRGTPLPTAHTIEVLDASIRGLGRVDVLVPQS